MLGGSTDLDASASALMERYPLQLIVLKLGRQGCRVYTHDRRIDVPPFEVSEVDPTGAGDSFDAGFLSGCWTDGRPRTPHEWLQPPAPSPQARSGRWRVTSGSRDGGGVASAPLKCSTVGRQGGVGRRGEGNSTWPAGMIQIRGRDRPQAASSELARPRALDSPGRASSASRPVRALAGCGCAHRRGGGGAQLRSGRLGRPLHTLGFESR